MTCTTEHLAVAIWTTVREHKLNIMWHSVGKLLDAMRSYRDRRYHSAAEVIEQMMFRNEKLTKSCFIRAMFAYMRFKRIVNKLDKINADQKASHGRANRKVRTVQRNLNRRKANDNKGKSPRSRATTRRVRKRA